MANASRKIEFNENHRRAISILMRGTERACDRILEWLERPSTLMTEVRDDLTSAERAELRKLVAELREEVHGFAAKAALDRSPASRRRSVAAILSTALIDLQEVRDSELKGYGRLPADEKRVLNEQIQRMVPLLERMLHVVESE
jgi:hypothetical protein